MDLHQLIERWFVVAIIVICFLLAVLFAAIQSGWI